MVEPAFHVRIFGHPVPWARPRAVRVPVGIRFFEKPEQLDWQRTMVAQVLPSKPATPFTGPIAVRYVFLLPRPISLPKKVVHHVKKPDLDNLVKHFDCFNGLIWKDDSQIVQLEAMKIYSSEPGVDIEVRLMGVVVDFKPSLPEAAQEAMKL